MEYLEQKTCQQIVVHVSNEPSRAGLHCSALVFSQKLEQIIYLAKHTHTYTHTQRSRENCRKGIAAEAEKQEF